MNRRRSVSAEVAHMRAEIKGKSNEQVEELYGIKFQPDGSVIDQADDQKYKNLIDWMQAYAQSIIEEEDEYDEDYRGYFDDEDF